MNAFSKDVVLSNLFIYGFLGLSLLGSENKAVEEME